MKKLTRAQWILFALGLLTTVAIPIMISLFTASLPDWVTKHPWFIGIILFLLIVIFVLLYILQATTPEQDNQSDKTTTSKKPISPYIVGTFIENPDYFFGRETEVDRFFANLNSPHPQSIQVLGIRRAGKTSFLRHVSHRDVVDKKAREDIKTLVIYIDLQSGIDTVANFYMTLGEGINNCLPKPKRLTLPSEGFTTKRAFDKWLHSLQLVDYRLIILLDEFDALREQAGFDPDFFKGLRSLMSPRLAWVISSYRDLYQLSKQLGKKEKTSPFFNIFNPRSIILAGLDPDTADAEQLIQKPAEPYNIFFSSEEITSIKQFAGSLPFFLQVAADIWFEAKQQGRASSLSEVKQEFATAMTRHFEWYWDDFNQDEKELLSLVATNKSTDWSAYRQQHGDGVLNNLFNYGLITKEGENNYRINGEVFAEWIHRQAP